MIIKTKSFELAVYARGDKDSKKVALVIPGRVDSKDYVHNTSLVELFAAQGYFALSFDPPGIWESPGNIDIYTTTNYIKAVNELIDFLGNKPTVLAGHSRGGSVAMLASSNLSVTALVLILATYGVPVPPGPEAVANGFQVSYRDMPPGDRITPQQKKFEVPISYFEDGNKYNPADALKGFLGPKLIIYSDGDEFGDSEEVERTYDSLEGQKVLRKVSCRHDYRRDSVAVGEVRKIVGEFFEKI